MRKFYKQAEAGTAPGGFVIRLDGKLLKTPLQANLILPSRELADIIAAEWNAQGQNIVPGTMPMTQLVNTMVDKSHGPDRIAMNADIVKYGSSDLVCYYATHPADLVARQEKHWRPLVRWMKDEFGIALETVQGIRYINQPEDSMQKLQKIIADLDPAAFTVVQLVTGIAGSAVIALAMLRGLITAEQAYDASCVDEIYQLEKWGEDKLARKKLDHIRAELLIADKFRRIYS